MFPDYIKHMDSNQAAARDARRWLQERVRTDWEWPNTPEPWSGSDEEVRDVVEFRERYYGTDSEEGPAETVRTGKSRAASASDPYIFDSPDAVGTTIQRQYQQKSLKRKRELEEEMSWNEGLAMYVARRDAWTGVDAVRKYGTRRHEEGSSSDASSATSPSSSPPLQKPVDSSCPHHAQHDSLMSDAPPPTPDSTASTNSNAASSLFAQTPDLPKAEASLDLVPVAPSLLSNNPIRTSITTKTYPDIFSKVVLSSRTPTVPINLTDMTRALVQGWKDSGEWPPKPNPPDPLMGRRLNATTRAGRTKEKMERMAEKATMVPGASGASAKHGHSHHGSGEFWADHPHLKKGVDSVKRVFRLSSSGSGEKERDVVRKTAHERSSLDKEGAVGKANGAS